MKRWVLFLSLLAASCGGPEPPPAKPPAPAPPKAEAPSRGVYAEMTTVDFEGKPVSGMVPIATLSANAFDEPIARGNATNEKGFSSFMVPPETHLFARAWDPQMRMFANNFYEMPAMKGNRAAPMTITMVPAAAVEAVVQGVNGEPLANSNVDLQLVHLERGPWWPSHGSTDLTGYVRFSPVPPGEYVVEISVAGVGTARSAKTFLPPTVTTSVGDMRLK